MSLPATLLGERHLDQSNLDAAADMFASIHCHNNSSDVGALQITVLCLRQEISLKLFKYLSWPRTSKRSRPLHSPEPTTWRVGWLSTDGECGKWANHICDCIKMNLCNIHRIKQHLDSGLIKL
jgi:hypothetical protein